MRWGGVVAAVVVPALWALPLVACSSAVSVSAGADAANPVCAQVLRAVPDELAGRERRETSAQSTAAWGEPAVVLRCGVEVPGPTGDPCRAVDSGGAVVDWVVRSDDAGATFTTFGRDPVLEVTVPAALSAQDGALPAAVLSELAGAADVVEQTRRCS